jgi:hypothetical protein
VATCRPVVLPLVLSLRVIEMRIPIPALRALPVMPVLEVEMEVLEVVAFVQERSR